MLLKYEYQKKIKNPSAEIFVFEELETNPVYKSKPMPKTMADSVLVFNDFECVGLIAQLKPDPEKNRKLGAEVYKQALALQLTAVSFNGHFNPELVLGFILAAYEFEGYYKTPKKKTLTLIFGASHQKNVEQIAALCSSVYWSRDLVNQPFNKLGTQQMVDQLTARATQSNFKLSLWDKARLKKEKCGGILAVNQASKVDPALVILEHKPKKPTNKKPIVLVGKGIVYDTGGLSLKPTPNSMDIMKCDMGGLACMAGTLDALAVSKSNKWVVCLLPITDNLISNTAIAPGDVITMRSGHTVEVMNTDAEGRLILADALDIAKDYNPHLVIDAATLTGSAVAAIGDLGAVLMGNAGTKTFHLINKIGELTGERVARFPFWEEYSEQLKSPIADLKNLGGPTAGSITAGKFLEHFVGYDWLHLDIAGPGYLKQGRDYTPAGGTGFGVRLLTSFINEL